MNSNLIVRKIDQTCDIIGGEQLLVQQGFYHVIGYVDIVKKINELPFEEVLSLFRSLILDGNIYSEFALHLLSGGMLHDKYFELDENLNPTKNNLNYQLKFDIDSDIDDMSEATMSTKDREKMLQSEIKSIEEEAKKAYESNRVNQHPSSDYTSEHLQKIHSITLDTNVDNLDWLGKNILNMSDADYGTFMVLLSEIRSSKN